jgi:DNA-binding transcriptional regulator YiaG
LADPDLERTYMAKRENELVAAVREGVGAFRRGWRLNVCRVKIESAPRYKARQIARIRREKLSVSQSVFARYMGVSPSTIRAWEQEQRTPSPLACRLIQVAEKRPEVLRELAGCNKWRCAGAEFPRRGDCTGRFHPGMASRPPQVSHGVYPLEGRAYDPIFAQV